MHAAMAAVFAPQLETPGAVTARKSSGNPSLIEAEYDSRVF